MERDQKPIVDAMLKASFTEVVQKSIALLLLNRIVSGAKPPYFKHLLSIQKKKDDLIAEIMRQYGLDTGADQTYYHDSLIKVFNQCIPLIKHKLGTGDYMGLCDMAGVS